MYLYVFLIGLTLSKPIPREVCKDEFGKSYFCEPTPTTPTGPREMCKDEFGKSYFCDTNYNYQYYEW
jgi:hypothetical protein